jgi:TatD DNase family protein
MQFYNLHTHTFTNSSEIVELVNQYPWEFHSSIPCYSIGIHPWYIDEKRLEDDLSVIDEKLALPECLALGECGLDNRIEIPIELQLLVFERQIILAQKHKKPLVLHLVGAYQELIAIKKKLKITVPIILHGFSKNEQLAKQLLDNGFYLSFGKYLLRNPALEKVFKNIPSDRFFLETDTVEESLENVYQLAAIYKELSVEEIKRQVHLNWNHVFSAK